MTGLPKVGKWLLVANLALSLAAGADRIGFPIPAVRRVLICQFELPVAQFVRRLATMRHALGAAADEHLLVDTRAAGQPAFHFEFPVVDTFVFVEKRPLVSRAVGSSLAAMGPRFDPAMAPYQLRLSRVSMEFEAASLMAAYRWRHPEVRVFVEDQNLIVYRIPG